MIQAFPYKTPMGFSQPSHELHADQVSAKSECAHQQALLVSEKPLKSRRYDEVFVKVKEASSFCV